MFGLLRGSHGDEWASRSSPRGAHRDHSRELDLEVEDFE
jgi:hypothetical protein